MNNESYKGGEHMSLTEIPGLDVQRGIAMTGGTMEAYYAVLSMFCKDSEDRLAYLGIIPETSALLQFATQVHALKSASGSIGAANVSSLAAELESAAKAGDISLIQDKLSTFTEQLSELVKNIKTTLEKNEELGMKNEKNFTSSNPNSSKLINKYLHDLASALDSCKAGEISRILKDIKEATRLEPLDPIRKESLERISDEVMMVEYDNAKKIVEELLSTGN